jgi:beta-ureidopropionase / N-carbamoyl-L-amino-acid hydrolase
MSAAAEPRLSRFRQDWTALSGFTDPAQPGWTRRAFSGPYRQARAWLQERMEEAGLRAGLDAAANLVGRSPGRQAGLRPVIIGSHTDTVAGGGRFDGVVGVLAGIEVARALRDAGLLLRHPLEVIDFLAEEPNDFGLSMVGSRAIAGTLDDAALARQDRDGQSLAEAIAAAGGRPAEIRGACRDAGSVAVYLELHIEQGPALERAGRPVGVVTAITGVTRYRVRLQGRADHAGGTPVASRLDALAGAAEVVLAMEQLWLDGAGVGTVGRLDVSPNAINVVPASATMWTDMRSVDSQVLDSRPAAFAAQVRQIAARRGLGAEVDLLSREPPVRTDPEVTAALAEVVSQLGLPCLQLPSYAGHDANQMAKIAPAGMLFVPSRAGRSHCPEEWTEPADIAAGLRALIAAVLRLDETAAG